MPSSTDSDSRTSRQQLKDAVDAVVNSFAKHTQGMGRVDVVEALQEFWQMKFSKGHPMPAGPKVNYQSDYFSSFPLVTFVTLPGGSCFASFQDCKNKSDSISSAAKIALMNSVFNEHPFRKITDTFIQSALEDAVKSYGGPFEDVNNNNTSIGVFHGLLVTNKGKSMLEFQEMMTMFQLLHWNDSLKAMKARNCSRQEVLDHYCHKPVDQEIRWQMALDWVTREGDCPGVVQREADRARREVHRARKGGRELRFIKEKLEILSLANTELANSRLS